MHKSLHRVQPGSFSSDVENGDPKHLRVNVAGGYPSSPKKSEPAGTYFAGRQVQPWHCRAALACAQTAFVIGSVYLKHCLQLVQGASFHPLTYAFAREAVAGPILLLLAWASTGRLVPKACDALRVAALGGCLFANQLLFILGISLSGVLVATCIQPTIPVFTLCIALATRAEQGSAQKFAGIASAVGGSMMMVLGGISSSAHHSAAEAQNLLLGNACLLGNTLSMSVYFVLAKTLVAK